jgi:cytochrome c-type biogenesis protein CcmH
MSRHDGSERLRGAASCRTRSAVLGFGLLLMAATAAADGGAARELEGRLIAPCCWTQTLDIHDSPIADQLRTEIKQRLGAGEPAAKIEDDLAARYGEKIRAVPRGEDPRVALPVIVGGAMGLAMLLLVWVGIGWLRRQRVDAQPAQPPHDVNKQLDEQLDKELEHLSDVS